MLFDFDYLKPRDWIRADFIYSAPHQIRLVFTGSLFDNQKLVVDDLASQSTSRIGAVDVAPVIGSTLAIIFAISVLVTARLVTNNVDVVNSVSSVFIPISAFVLALFSVTFARLMQKVRVPKLPDRAYKHRKTFALKPER